jgi:hypothetical protein
MNMGYVSLAQTSALLGAVVVYLCVRALFIEIVGEYYSKFIYCLTKKFPFETNLDFTTAQITHIFFPLYISFFFLRINKMDTVDITPLSRLAPRPRS